MNLSHLESEARRLTADKQRGLPLLEHDRTRDRLTPARMRDLGTHVRTIVAALGRPNATDVAAAELTDASAERVKSYLVAQGKKQGVVDSTLGTIRLLRDLAIELGVEVWVAPRLARPTRLKVHRRIEGTRKYVFAARAAHVVNNDPYGLRFADWPDALRREFEQEIKPFFCDPTADRRSKKRPASDAYMVTWQNRAERAFGFLLNELGVPAETLSFRSLMDYQVLLAYYRWLFERRGKRYTTTTKGDLDQWRHLAARLYDLPDLAEKLRALIYDNTDWETVKDKEELALRVHADDLYVMFYALVAEAEHYEAHVHQKYGRVDAHALAAHKWMEAGVVGLTVVTWLREANVAHATPRNLYRHDDGAWLFTFKRRQMKSKRDHADYVVDLWKGHEAQGLLARVLDKCVALRPNLLGRFRAANPGRRDPETFFLNAKGRPYATSTVRRLFNSASLRYLGPAKRISPHDVRTIAPSWLFVREGMPILPTVQRRLDHAHIRTTERFYLKVEKLFDSRLTQLQMEERAKARKVQDRLHKLPDEMAALLARFKDEIIRTQTATTVDPAVLRQVLLEVLGTGDGDDGPDGLAPVLRPRS